MYIFASIIFLNCFQILQQYPNLEILQRRYCLGRVPLLNALPMQVLLHSIFGRMQLKELLPAMTDFSALIKSMILMLETTLVLQRIAWVQTASLFWLKLRVSFICVLVFLSVREVYCYTLLRHL